MIHLPTKLLAKTILNHKIQPVFFSLSRCKNHERDVVTTEVVGLSLAKASRLSVSTDEVTVPRKYHNFCLLFWSAASNNFGNLMLLYLTLDAAPNPFPFRSLVDSGG